MRSLQKTLDAARARGRKTLIPYLMSGFPNRETFRELVQRVQDEDVDALEIGLPFSDPLADGPVIQAAGQRALDNGTDLAKTLEDTALLAARRPDLPLILMTYINPLRACGIEDAAKACAESGITGWIVPDRDLDAPDEVIKPAKQAKLASIPLIAPTTPDERLPKVLRGSSGFAYLVSLTGVTGARQGRRLDVGDYVARVRAHTRLPICIGFGISGRDQARDAAQHADGVIVGSALLAPFLERSTDEAKASLSSTLQAIRQGLETEG